MPELTFKFKLLVIIQCLLLRPLGLTKLESLFKYDRLPKILPFEMITISLPQNSGLLFALV